MKSPNTLARRAALPAACAALLLLAGCGQKGPLYMPRIPPDPLAQTQPRSQPKPDAPESGDAADDAKPAAPVGAGK